MNSTNYEKQINDLMSGSDIYINGLLRISQEDYLAEVGNEYINFYEDTYGDVKQLIRGYMTPEEVINNKRIAYEVAERMIDKVVPPDISKNYNRPVWN